MGDPKWAVGMRSICGMAVTSVVKLYDYASGTAIIFVLDEREARLVDIDRGVRPNNHPLSTDPSGYRVTFDHDVANEHTYRIGCYGEDWPRPATIDTFHTGGPVEGDAAVPANLEMHIGGIISTPGSMGFNNSLISPGRTYPKND